MSVASEPATQVELEEEQRQVEEAQAGNLDAMRPILERYAQPLYGTVILPRLGDAVSAEEVLRDTLATAVEKIRRFTWQGKSIYPWLRQMVRIVVGTLSEVGTGMRTAGQVAEILESRDRTTAGITAPAHGLELIEVRYDGTRPAGV